MDSRDRDAISDLFRKLHDVERQAGPRDAEAEKLISDETGRLPGAPYYMAQTIVMQDMALNAKQQEVEDLKRRLETAESGAGREAEAEGGGFLSRMVGGGSSQAPSPSRPTDQGGGPWGAARPQNVQPQNQYAPSPPPPYPQQGYAPQGGFGRGMGGGGFLTGAAQTAMGVAGGVVLGNALGSMLGGHGFGFGGSEPNVTEVNETTNIIEDDRNGDATPASDDGDNAAAGSDPDDGYQDASFDGGDLDDGSGGYDDV